MTDLAEAGAVPERAEIRDWLRTNVPAGRMVDPESGGPITPAQLEWERTLHDAGYAAVHWPIEHGGRGADLAARMVFQEEYELCGAPPRLNMMGLMLAGPTIMRYGTDEQKTRWLQPILNCDEIWCQGFSEPDAGSDLAGLRTTAVIDGDRMVVNGQKIWTSGATNSQWILALVRTSRDSRPQSGITFVMIDMTTPGIEIRPITQISGATGFCEVFFTDVSVPLDNVMGSIGDGWAVAMNALGHERGAGRRSYVTFLRDLAQIKKFVDGFGLADDLVIQQELGALLAQINTYRHHVGRTVANSDGAHPRPEASYNKLYWSEMTTRLHEVGMRVLGQRPEAARSAELADAITAWQADYWLSRASRIFAGTNQVQKNIISERVLGLPKEPRR
jgi:alkylation response protein AidB-like acyl-CoA dehydrogenase